jgi:hypothetical protein
MKTVSQLGLTGLLLIAFAASARSDSGESASHHIFATTTQLSSGGTLRLTIDLVQPDDSYLVYGDVSNDPSGSQTRAVRLSVAAADSGTALGTGVATFAALLAGTTTADNAIATATYAGVALTIDEAPPPPSTAKAGDWVELPSFAFGVSGLTGGNSASAAARSVASQLCLTAPCNSGIGK